MQLYGTTVSENNSRLWKRPTIFRWHVERHRAAGANGYRQQRGLRFESSKTSILCNISGGQCPYSEAFGLFPAHSKRIMQRHRFPIRLYYLWQTSHFSFFLTNRDVRFEADAIVGIPMPVMRISASTQLGQTLGRRASNMRKLS